MSKEDIAVEGLHADDQDLQFRKRADTFIDIANGHCERETPAVVSSSFLYGASRFCAFVVAGKTGTGKRYDQEREAALDYYSAEFRKMLEQNLDDYRRVFDALSN